MGKEVFIHVGMMKTGTTFLQKNIFPHLEDIYFIDENDTVGKIIKEIPYKNRFQVNINESKEKISNFFNKIKEKKVLISWEALVGDPYSNFYNFDFINDTLSRLFDNPKIIFVFRKQDEWLESLYIQSLHSGFYQSISKFLNYNNGVFGDYKPVRNVGINIDVKILNYNNFVLSYYEVFGQNNVLALPYELLKKDSNIFINKILNFLKIEKFGQFNIEERENNKSYSIVSAYIALFLNRFLRNGRNGFWFIVDKPFSYKFYLCKDKSKVCKFLYSITSQISLRFFLQNIVDKIFYKKAQFINDDIRKRIMNYHSETNSLLDKEFDLNLKDYGYYS